MPQWSLAPTTAAWNGVVVGFCTLVLSGTAPGAFRCAVFGGNRASEVRIGRFLRNGKVAMKKIVEQAASGTARRVAGLDILAIQDTTSFRDDRLDNSLVSHATIAVEAEHGALLGLVDGRIIERHGGGGRRRRIGACAACRKSWASRGTSFIGSGAPSV